MAATKYKRFGLALVEWLRADTGAGGLVAALTSAGGNANSIYITERATEPLVPSLELMYSFRPALSDVDDLYLSVVLCTASAKTGDEALDIIGAVAELAAQRMVDSKLVDAEFENAPLNIRTIGIIPQGVDELAGELVTAPNRISADYRMDIRWRETA